MTSPSLEAAGQATGLLVPMPIWAGLHACRPRAAAELSVSPSGNVSFASLMSDVLISSGWEFCGTLTVVVAPSTASD